MVPWIQSSLGKSQQHFAAIYGEKGIFAVLAVFWYEGAQNSSYKSKHKGGILFEGFRLVHNRCVQSAGGQHCDRFSIAGLQEIEAVGTVTMKRPAGKDGGETRGLILPTQTIHKKEGKSLKITMHFSINFDPPQMGVL